MMQVNCPHCGERAQNEFSYVRSMDSIVSLEMPAAEAMAMLYTRSNPKGVSDELWRHSYGCRQFLILRRHTVSHEILKVSPYGEAAE